jgi:hypothetical protein
VWRALSGFLGAALVLLAPPAWASPPAVHLSVENCDSLDEPSIRRILSADLGSPTTVEVGPEVTEVAIACEAERVVIRVKDPLSRKTLRRSFDPRSFGNKAQSRIVAIAASELVLASWAELEANPAPKVPAEGEPVQAEAVERARDAVRARTPPPATASTPKTAPAPPPPRPVQHARTSPQSLEAGGDGDPMDDDSPVRPRYESRSRFGGRMNAYGDVPVAEDDTAVFKRLTGVLSVRSFFRGDGTLIGGGGRIGHERFGVVSWAADMLVENGTLKGRNLTSATVGGWLQFYARAGSAATFRLGGGLRAGVLGMAEGVTVAAWGWPMLVTSHTLRAGPVVFDLSAEAGFVDLLLRRNQGVRGPWASGQVGLGVVL